MQRKITRPNNAHLEGWWVGGTAYLILAILGWGAYTEISDLIFRINVMSIYMQQLHNAHN